MKISNTLSNHRDNTRKLVLHGIDRFGHCIHVNDALAKESYDCCFCRARMHLSHRNGKKFFVCYTGEKHTHELCRAGSMVHDITLTDPNTYFNGLYTETQHREPGVPGIGPDRGPRDGSYPCTSLKHIYQTGIFTYPAKNDRFGNFYLGKILLTKRMLPHVMREKCSLLNRIIYALPDWIDYKNRTIRFVVLHNTRQNDAPFTENMRFILTFGDKQQEFEHFRNKLFDASGKAISEPVVVAAEWHYSPHPDCFKSCGKTHCSSVSRQCMASQTGIFHCSKQIYIPPLKNRSAKKPVDHYHKESI